MMNILLVSGPGIALKEPFNSGIEAFIVSLANELVNAGHAVTVIAEEAEADRKFTLLNPFTAAEPDFYIHPLDKQQRKLSNEQRQFSELDVSSYDVIHYNMFYPHLLEAGLSFQKASLLTLHSPAEPTRIAAYQKLTQQSDLNFVAISERVKQQWDQALRMDMPLINNGINMELLPIKSPGKGNYLVWAALTAQTFQLLNSEIGKKSFAEVFQTDCTELVQESSPKVFQSYDSDLRKKTSVQSFQGNSTESAKASLPETLPTDYTKLFNAFAPQLIAQKLKHWHA